ncbi:MAG: hypothetical protein H6767_06625 [Candidatus Peribacteria bacterium]|nr:MAG: hypothetical protein H6767_06625 [Candidatus Peribacteria bacterium]
MLADPQKEAMQGLVQTSEALRQAVQALRDQLAAQPNLTPQQTQQIELYDRVIQGWESLNREYISPALSTAAIEFGVLDDRIDSLYRRMVIDLRAINVASIEPQLDNAINAIDALRGLVVETNLDEEAKA